MNYTGDVLNFGVAVERARAAGVAAEMVIIGDDVGVGRSKAGKVGRRGIAGTILVHKIAGALVAAGNPLDEVARVARQVGSNLVSVGASLCHVHVPGRRTVEGTDLPLGDVEIGMGIHNEPGSERASLELPLLVTKMLLQLLDPEDKDRAFLGATPHRVVLMINNLGGVSNLEMGGITTEVANQLAATYGIRPVRVYSGTYMTSLNGLGFSISLLDVGSENFQGLDIVACLDAPTQVLGWSAPIQSEAWSANFIDTEATSAINNESQPSDFKVDASHAKTALIRALKDLIAAEPAITEYDTVVGDGDCGICLKRGAEGILEHIEESGLTGDVVVDITSIIPIVERTMDGTSGALYSIFLHALITAIRNRLPGPTSPKTWASVLKQSSDVLSKYTPAQPGDRTLIDALYPFIEVLFSSENFKQAADAAMKGAEKTKGMHASLGRTVYVGGYGYQKVPDPGAWGLAIFLGGLAS
ncbi:hypothetical protein ACHAQA_006704 [Verticillium albo-atrum]